MRVTNRISALSPEAGTVYVCVCKGVRLSEAVESAKKRGCSPDALTETWGFDDGDACGRCLNNVERISEMVELKLEGLLVKAG